MDWYKKSQQNNVTIDNIIWAIDELWLTSGIISGPALEEVFKKYILNAWSSQEGDIFSFEDENTAIPKAAQTIILSQSIKGIKKRVMDLFIKGYSRMEMARLTGLSSDEITNIIREKYETKKDESNYLDREYGDKIQNIVDKNQNASVPVPITEKQIAEILKITESLVRTICKNHNIVLHEIVLDRRTEIENIIVEFVKRNGKETFKSTKEVFEKFKQQTTHSIKISYSDVHMALLYRNMVVKANSSNTLFLALRVYLTRAKGDRITWAAFLNSNRLQLAVDRFVKIVAPHHGYPDPPDQSRLKEYFILKIQMRNRSKEYWGNEERYYKNYFDENMSKKVIQSIEQGLSPEQISKQLNVNLNKVQMMAQIYRIRNESFDFRDKNSPDLRTESKNIINWFKKYAKWKEHIPGGRAEGKTPDDYEKSQIEKGRDVEMEHTPNPDVAREISMDHLEEFDEYYTGLEHMEKLLEHLKKRKESK